MKSELNRLLYEALDSVNVGLAILDPQEHFAGANNTYRSMLGAQDAGLPGQHWRGTVGESDYAAVQEAFGQARLTGRGYVEIQPLRTDPSVIYAGLSINRMLDASGELAGFRCVRHDVSSDQRNQLALLLAVESAPNGLLMLDGAGQIQSVNKAVEKLFGYTREELIGCTVETLLPERFRARHLRYRDSFSMQAMAGRDLSGLRKDGVEIPLQVYLNRIDAGKGPLILCTIIDIAERVQYERQLEVAKQAAEAANRAKSDFLARMSHEIRTPMNLIMGMNALLLNTPLDGQQRQQVEISYRNVRRLLRLINRILDLSKVEAGQFTLEEVPFDLNAILDEGAATIASAIEQKGLQLSIFVEPDVWRYWTGDGERLQQVLLNLLGNSMKFTAMGRIDVRVSMEHRDAGEAGLRFEVSDTGCGVPPEKAQVIFDAFQQADGTMNRAYEGTGLGLTIARTLVEMMGGRIWVKEPSGAGSTFVFTAFLPRATEAAVRERQARSTSDTTVQKVNAGTRILVVDDNPENQILLAAYLDGLGLSLEFASNGVEAVHKCQHGAWDLILMDIQMPVMDGYAATREIRIWQASHGLQPVPIVALTAHALSGATQESIDAGCDGHLTKPVERGDLIRAIAEFARNPLERLKPVEDPIQAYRPVFLSNRRRDLARILEALANGDFPTVQSIGHDCKGTGTGYGFPEISRAGAGLEAAARNRDAEHVEAAIGQFEKCLVDAGGG